jgi:dolichol-phosphate mannosyltransferase
MESKKTISIVLPVYNEAGSLKELHSLLKGVAGSHQQYNFEIIFICDGCIDNSVEVIHEIRQSDPSIRVIEFTRNFGHQVALTAGYDYANGDAVISMDADLQDPPGILPEMIRKWEEGNLVVYARRRNRKDPYIRRQIFRFYYRIFEKVSDVKIPRNVGDFRLVDKRVVREIRNLKEKYRYLRGMVAWFGYKHDFVDYDRPGRESGESGYTYKKMFRLAFDAFTGFSLFPLKIAAILGITTSIVGILYIIWLVVEFFWFHWVHPTSDWLITVVFIFLGAQSVLLWLIGEYIGRIHDEQKDRPLYVVNKTYNLHE